MIGVGQAWKECFGLARPSPHPRPGHPFCWRVPFCDSPSLASEPPVPSQYNQSSHQSRDISPYQHQGHFQPFLEWVLVHSLTSLNSNVSPAGRFCQYWMTCSAVSLGRFTAYITRAWVMSRGRMQMTQSCSGLRRGWAMKELFRNCTRYCPGTGWKQPVPGQSGAWVCT